MAKVEIKPNIFIGKDEIKSGVNIPFHYIKCPHLDKNCKWTLKGNHNGYEYLDNACYLSGSFRLDCPK